MGSMVLYVFLNKKKMPVRKSLTDYHITSNIFEAD